jgi:hypothetical protein
MMRTFFFFLISYCFLNGQSIITQNTPLNVYCENQLFSIPFSITGGPFNLGNYFVAELSDPFGGFGSPRVLDSVQAVSDDIVQLSLPSGIVYGTGYRVRIVGRSPSVIGSANTINLSLMPAIAPVTIDYDQTLCTGSSTQVLSGGFPNGGDGTFNYTWQSSSDQSSWSVISGQTGPTYPPFSLTTTQFYRRVVSSGVCAPYTSNFVSLIHEASIGSNTIGSSQSICSGTAPVGFTGSTPTGGSGNYTFQWQSSSNNSNWFNIIGASLQNYTHGSILSSSIYFRRIVSTNGLCAPSTSVPISVIVTNVISNNVNSASQTICIGNPASILLGSTPLGGTGSYNYQWFSSTDNSGWAAISGATAINFNPGVLSFSTYFYRNIISGPCSSNATSILITVNSHIGNNIIGNAQTICSGSSFSNLTGTIASGGNGLYSFQWQSSSDQSSWANIIGSTSNGLTGMNLTNSTYFRRIVSSGPCAASTSINVHVLVNPLPSAVITNTGNLTYCQGDSVVLSVPPSTSYLWSNLATTQSITVFGTSSYSIQVTNGFGCQASSNVVNTTMNSLPNPVISGASTLCAGNSTILSTTSFNSYLWNTGHTTQSIQINSAGSYSVRVQGSNGCFGNSAAFVITVLPNPVPSITPSGPLTFCQGGSVSLNGGSFTSHKWNTGSTNQSINVSTSGFYIDTVTNIQGCRAWSSVQVVVNPLPQPVIIPAGSTTFCSGENLRLFLGSGYSSYLWNTGATTSSITVSSTGNYHVNVTDQNGCTGSSSSLSTTVQNVPIIGISANGPTSFCQGNSVFLSASGANSYVWSNGATSSGIVVSTSGSYSVTGASNGCSSISGIIPVTVVNPAPVQIFSSRPTTFCQGDSVILTATPGNSYLWSNGSTSPSISVKTTSTITVTVTNSGCPATSPAVLITVNPNPIASITLSSSNTICPGDTVTLISSTGSGYSWSSGNTNRSIPVTQAGTYSVRVTNGFGCETVSSVVNIQVRNPITPIITSNAGWSFCIGDSIILTSTIRNQYLWNTGDTTRSIVVKSPGVYQLSAIDSFSCVTNSLPVTVNMNALPVATIQADGPTSFCQGGSVILASSATGSYSWSTGANTQSITVNQSGSYILIFTDVNGCKNNASLTVWVNERPTPSITIQNVSSFCRGQQLILSLDSFYDDVLWSNGQTTNSIHVQNSGDYSVVVSRKGCSGSHSKEVLLGYLPPTGKLVIKAGKIETGILVCREEGKNYMWGFEPKNNPGGVENYACIADCRSWIKYDKLDTANYYYWVYVGDLTCMRKWYFNAPVTFRLSEEQDATSIFKIYPNPATEVLNIYADFVTEIEGVVRVNLLDLQGRVISHEQLDIVGNNLSFTMKTNDIPKGSYILKVEGRGSRWIQKVLLY